MIFPPCDWVIAVSLYAGAMFMRDTDYQCTLKRQTICNHRKGLQIICILERSLYVISFNESFKRILIFDKFRFTLKFGR